MFISCPSHQQYLCYCLHICRVAHIGNLHSHTKLLGPVTHFFALSGNIGHLPPHLSHLANLGMINLLRKHLSPQYTSFKHHYGDSVNIHAGDRTSRPLLTREAPSTVYLRHECRSKPRVQGSQLHGEHAKADNAMFCDTQYTAMYHQI